MNADKNLAGDLAMLALMAATDEERDDLVDRIPMAGLSSEQRTTLSQATTEAQTINALMEIAGITP